MNSSGAHGFLSVTHGDVTQANFQCHFLSHLGRLSLYNTMNVWKP